MAGISYTDLRTQIRNYTEVSSTVLSDSIIENIVLNAEYRIFRDLPLDAYRKTATDNLVANQEHANVPAGSLFVRSVQVADGTSTLTNPIFLEKRDKKLDSYEVNFSFNGKLNVDTEKLLQKYDFKNKGNNYSAIFE